MVTHVNDVTVCTQSMGTPQTASGCAVTPEELAGLEAVLQLIRAVIDQVSYATYLQQRLFVVTRWREY